MMKKIALLFSVLALWGGYGWSLDAVEIEQLMRNGVEEAVVINMVRGRKLDRPLTAGEVLNLSEAGASGALLEYLTRPESVSDSYVASQSAAPVYVEPAPVHIQQPATVVAAPPVVLASPPALYYDRGPRYVYPYRHYPRFSFSFGFGHGRGSYRHHRPPYRHFRHPPRRR